MRKGIWISILCVVILCMLRISYVMGSRRSVRDWCAFLSREQVEVLKVQAPWLEHAKLKQAGSLLIVSPAETNRATALIVPSRKPYFPFVLVEDRADVPTGVPASIGVIDGRNNQIDLLDENGDGVFDSCTIITGSGTNRTAVSDRNFDGEFDIRLSPNGKNAIMLSNAWHEFIHTPDGKMAIETIEGLRYPKFRDGKWLLLSAEGTE